jgi:hypothetical protein
LRTTQRANTYSHSTPESDAYRNYDPNRNTTSSNTYFDADA